MGILNSLFGGRNRSSFSRQDISIIEQQANRLAEIVNESLQIAVTTTSPETQISRVDVAKNMVQRLKSMALQYDFLELTDLDQVEADIHTLEEKSSKHKASHSIILYDRAVELRKAGNPAEAAALLEPTCEVPNVYKGWYRELFVCWRQLNREFIKAKDWRVVVDRILRMIQFDDEMINEMLEHWGEVQGRELPDGYFDKDRNLKLTDAKHLLKAAEATGDRKSADVARLWLKYFELKRTKP